MPEGDQPNEDPSPPTAAGPRSGSRPDERALPVSVVVLTYNSAPSLAACLRTIAPQVEQLGGELLVVDNDSQDGTVAIAQDLGFEVVQTGANLGFAAGCNAGARHANGEILVFANPDTALDDGCLRELVRRVHVDARIGPVGGRGRDPDGAYDPTCVLGPPSVVGALSFALGADRALRDTQLFGVEHGPSSLPDDGRVLRAAAVTGALMALPRELWDELGGFDERFFLYGEDVDLCVRAAALGWQPAVATGAGYHHEKKVSSGGSSFRDVLLFRGKAELYRAHLGPIAATIALAAVQLGAAARGAWSWLPLPRLARRGAPWWELFQQRDSWRHGFRDHRPAG